MAQRLPSLSAIVTQRMCLTRLPKTVLKPLSNAPAYQLNCQPVIGPRPFRDKAKSAECNRRFKRILSHKKFQLKEVDYILFSARWKAWAIEILPETIGAIRGVTDARIIIFGPTIEFSPEVPILIARHGRRQGLEAHVNHYQVKERLAVNERLAQIAKQLGLAIMSIKSTLCAHNLLAPLLTLRAESRCSRTTGIGTMEGAAYFGRRLKNKMPNAAALFQ